jgi:hypothetical protein
MCNIIIITGKTALFELSLPQKVLPDLSIQLHHLVGLQVCATSSSLLAKQPFLS